MTAGCRDTPTAASCRGSKSVLDRWGTAAATGALVTAEEHSIIGGLGGAVAETISDACPVPLKRVGVPDRFAETGPYHAILDRYGLSIAHVVAAARAAVALKK